MVWAPCRISKVTQILSQHHDPYPGRSIHDGYIDSMLRVVDIAIKTDFWILQPAMSMYIDTTLLNVVLSV